jgi:hypothetical protein
VFSCTYSACGQGCLAGQLGMSEARGREQEEDASRRCHPVGSVCWRSEASRSSHSTALVGKLEVEVQESALSYRGRIIASTGNVPPGEEQSDELDYRVTQQGIKALS